MLSRLREVAFRLCASLRGERGSETARLREELAHHRAMLESEGANRREAALRLGGQDQVEEAWRGQRGLPWLDDFIRDLRHALRLLRRYRGLSTVVVLTLGLAIGANTAIFSLVDALFLRALPVRDPQHLMLLTWQAHRFPDYQGYADNGDCVATGVLSGLNASSCSFSRPFFDAVRRQARAFESVTAADANGGLYTVTGRGPAFMVATPAVAGNYFDVLGVKAAIGRLLTPADDRAGAPPAIVLSYAEWQRQFGGSPSIVGTTIDVNRVNRVAMTVVGVASPSFTNLAPGSGVSGWIPLSDLRLVSPFAGDNGPDDVHLVLLGRLRPGARVGEAQAEVSGMFRAAMLAGPKPLSNPGDNPRVTLESAQRGLDGIRSQYGQPLAVLMWTVGLILMLACANIAGLLLGRAQEREKELAVRRALGAGAARLLRQTLAESLLLAGLGGAIGLAIAWWGARTLKDFILSSRPVEFGLNLRVALDGHVLLFTLGATLVTGVLFGLAPALGGSRLDLSRALKDATGSNGAAGRRRGWLRLGNLLVVLQISLGMIVLAGSGLLVHTLVDLRMVNPGFDASHLLTFIVWPQPGSLNGTAAMRLVERVESRISALPGVENVGFSGNPPLSGTSATSDFRVNGEKIQTGTLAVGPGFFRALRIPLVAGRRFRPADFEAADAGSVSPRQKPAILPPQPVVVNQAFANTYYAGGSAVGGLLGPTSTADTTSERVVGVVADSKFESLQGPTEPMVYFPSAMGFGTFEVRTSGDPLAMLPAVRRVVGTIAPDVPILSASSEAQNIDRLIFRQRMMADLSSCFAGLALLLACIGLYGLLAQEVMRRKREIGIRMTLGARRSEVLRGVLASGIRLALAGIGIGAAGALALNRYLQSMLFGVQPSDATTLAIVAVLLLTLSLVGCLAPAYRAVSVDPLEALRSE